MKICRRRYEAGKLFLHEHPHGSKSWDRSSVQDLLNKEGVAYVKGPVCRWGFEASGRHGFARRETGWMTNSSILAAILDGVCASQPLPRGEPYRRVRLVGGGRARQVQAYPSVLVKSILRGLREEVR